MSGYTKGKCFCGNSQESKGRYKGKQLFSRYCSSCKKNKSKYAHLFKESLECSSCGFKAINKCQLDVDHIDGNHKNNDSSNLQVLCANCHRLKTYISEDWKQ